MKLSFTVQYFALVISIILSLRGVTGAPFTENGDGTVADQKSNLIWQKCSMGQNNNSECSDDGVTTNNTADWADAVIYCNTLSLAGRTWRLPSVNELKSIVDETKFNPIIDINYFSNTFVDSYWTSTTYAPSKNAAWLIWFANDGVIAPSTKTISNHARCVSGP